MDIFEIAPEKIEKEYNFKKFESIKKIFGTISFIISSQYYVDEDELVSDVINKFELYPELLSISVVDKNNKILGIIIRRELFNLITKDFSEDYILLRKIKDFVKEVKTFFVYKDIFSLQNEIKFDLSSSEIKYYIAIDENEKPVGTFSTRDLLMYFSRIIQLDINTAYLIQQKIISKDINIRFKNYNICAVNKMAYGVGGDFYYFKNYNDKLFFFIVDVSGKGYAASLITSLIKGIADSFDWSRGIDVFVEVLNRNIFLIFEGEKYLTGIFCEITENEINFIDTGHSHFYVFTEKKFCRLKSNFEYPPIGISENIKVKTSRVEIKNFSGYLFLTDGIIEQTNYKGEEFSISRVGNLLMKNISLDPAQILNIILSSLEKYRKDFYQKDDWTIILLKSDKKN